jgi:DNA-binding LacI/PurR family transcriptional regulator
VKSIEAAAFERGYDVVLSNTNYDPARAAHYVRRFIERKVAGVALMTSEMDKSLIDDWRGAKFRSCFWIRAKPVCI